MQEKGYRKMKGEIGEIMSKNKRLLSILLSAVVMLTMSGVGVFAANDVDAAAADPDTVAMDAQSVDATEAVDEAAPDFEAQDVDLSTATVEFLEKSGDDDITWQYTGQEIKPPVQVKVGDTVLQEGQDYTLTYENNIELTSEGHEAYAVATAVEGSGYTGVAKAVFFIEEMDDVDLEDPNVEIEDIDEQVYTGSAIEPKPAVTYEGKTLVEGTHYTLSYANNVELSTDDVMATVTITAIEGSGFTGAVTAEFRIVDELPALSSVKHLDAMAGCESITLTWDPVEGADTYLIWRTDQKWGSKAQGYYWPRDLKSLPSSRGDKWDKIAKHPKWANHNKGTVDIYKKYTYKVYAARYVEGATQAGKGQVKIGKQVYEVSQVKTIKKKCVSKLRITVRVHSGTTLTSRDGKNKHLTVHSGDKIVTDGYGAGCYYFTKKDARFRIMNERVSASNADYLKDYDYTKKEAEYFINNGDYLKYARPKSTSKKYFIWVSTYTQHVYAFKKSGGKWELIRDWHCSSGDKNTPSPNGNKELWKKIRYRHSTDYWNCFSTLNALHGIKPASVAGYDWTRYLGQIKSGGCVRNLDKNAGWIYKNVPTGTKILVY